MNNPERERTQSIKRIARRLRRRAERPALIHILINLKSRLSIGDNSLTYKGKLKQLLFKPEWHREHMIKDGVIAYYTDWCYTPYIDRPDTGYITLMVDGKVISEPAYFADLPF